MNRLLVLLLVSGCMTAIRGGSFVVRPGNSYTIHASAQGSGFDRAAYDICRLRHGTGFTLLGMPQHDTSFGQTYLRGDIECSGPISAALADRFAAKRGTFATRAGSDAAHYYFEWKLL